MPLQFWNGRNFTFDETCGQQGIIGKQLLRSMSFAINLDWDEKQQALHRKFHDEKVSRVLSRCITIDQRK